MYPGSGKPWNAEGGSQSSARGGAKAWICPRVCHRGPQGGSQIVFAVLRKNGNATEALRGDREIMLAAVQADPNALGFATDMNAQGPDLRDGSEEGVPLAQAHHAVRTQHRGVSSVVA
eukprot:2802869-Amphidinium_carterae.1